MAHPSRSRAAALGLAGIVLLASCGSDDASRTSDEVVDATEATDAGADETAPDESAATDSSVAPAPAGDGWTVLVYSIADTDLEPFMMDDLVQLASVGSNENVDLVALVDRAADYSSDPLLNEPDWVGGKLFDVGRDELTEVEDLGDIDTGDPELLSSFITRGITEHPAAHYALVMSDHGASWPGIGGDESSDEDSLSVSELQQAIGTGLADAGVPKLDLLGFDACLMSSYEVASAMQTYADRLVASQELEPGHGWNYASFSVLADDPTTTVDALASAIIDGFEAEADSEGTGDSVTLASIDLTKMGAVDEALGEFTGKLLDAAAEVAPVVGKNLASALGFGTSPDPTEDTHMKDLGLLVSEIGTDALNVSDAADGVVRAINDAVVDKVAGSSLQGATGLSIYFPPTKDLYDAAYGDLPIASSWSDFLDAYYGAGDAIPTDVFPTFLDPEKVAEVSFEDGGLVISGAFDADSLENISDVVMSYGTVDADGTITFFGDETASLAEDGSAVASGFYDLTSLVISDGQTSAVAYMTLTDDTESGTYTLDVPMAYYAPGDENGETYQDVLLTLTVDAESGDILDETYYVYDDDLGTYGELTADPDGTIVPEVLTVTADGTNEWVPTSDTGLRAELGSLEYDFSPLDSGTSIYVELTITDFGGNSDTVSAVVEVP